VSHSTRRRCALGPGEFLGAGPGEGGAAAVFGGVVEEGEERGAEGWGIVGRDVDGGFAEEAAGGGQVAGDDGRPWER